MSLRLVMAAVAAVAVPVAVYAQTPGPLFEVAPRKSERRICEVTNEVGSRLGRARRCYSKSEHDAMKAESRETVDRVQALKAFSNIDPDNLRGGGPSGSAPPR